MYLSLNSASEPRSASSGDDERCLPPSFGACFRLIMRAAKVGVSVNETNSETAMANDEVKPNDDINRPTIPAMNPTGRKTASSERVVAATARPRCRYGDGRDKGRAKTPKKYKHYDGRENAAFNQVQLNRVQGRLNEDRLIADYLGLNIQRQGGL